jgi:hypothetical protein
MVTTTIMITAIIIEPLIRQHEAHRIMATGALPDSATQPDVSPLVDTGPARAPQAVVLEGRFGRVEKLEPSRHHADLWAGLAAKTKSGPTCPTDRSPTPPHSSNGS